MRGPRFEVYERNDGQYDWRLKAGNAEVVATSHREGFRDRTDAERAIRGVAYAVLEMIMDSPEEEVELTGGLEIVHLAAGELGMTPGEETDSGGEQAQEHEENAGDAEAKDDAGEAGLGGSVDAGADPT